MIATQKNAVKIINSLTGNKLKDAYNYLIYLKDKEEWEATQELMELPILAEIQEGIKQLQNSQYVKFSDIRKNV